MAIKMLDPLGGVLSAHEAIKMSDSHGGTMLPTRILK